MGEDSEWDEQLIKKKKKWLEKSNRGYALLHIKRVKREHRLCLQWVRYETCGQPQLKC